MRQARALKAWGLTCVKLSLSFLLFHMYRAVKESMSKLNKFKHRVNQFSLISNNAFLCHA